LWNRNCGMLPVVDAQQKVIGVVTDRDLCMALGTRNRLPGDVTVGEVVSGQIYSCKAQDDIRAALETMASRKVRRLPVVNEKGLLEGILSIDDIVLHEDLFGDGKAAELSPREIVSTLQRVYGPRLPQVVKPRATAA